MCGIVGVITKASNGFSSLQVDRFKEMLHIDMLRGPDSTGVFSVSTNNEVRLVKQAAPPFVFNSGKYVADLYTEAVKTGRILIGHNRKATSGGINSNLAHPFVEKGTIMVHNGNLQNHEKYYKTQVDSEALCKILADSSKPEDYIKTFNSINGAFAVVWYNGNTGNLHIFRNTQRPLHYYEHFESIVLASEKELMLFNKEKASATNAEIKEFEAGFLYTVDFWGKMSRFETKANTYSGSYQGGHWQEDYSGGGYYPAVSSNKSSKQVTKIKEGEKFGKKTLEVLGTDIGKTILFQPNDYTKSSVQGSDFEYFNLKGDAWIPGAAKVSAMLTMKLSPGQEQTLKTITTSTEIYKATIRNAVDENGEPGKVYLAEMHVCRDLDVKDWSGRIIVEEELEYLKGSIACEACQEIFHGEKTDLTDMILYHRGSYVTVDEKGNQILDERTIGNYACICKSCLAKYVDGKEVSNEFYEIVDRAVEAKVAIS